MEFLLLALLGLGITLDIAGVFGRSESGNDDPNADGDTVTTRSGETWTGAGDDHITALASAKVHAGDGDDTLSAFGDATVFGGTGQDDIIAKNAGPTYGEAGNDRINAYRGTSFGNDGDDTLFGYWDADVYGGRGQDVIDISGTGTAYGGGGGDKMTTTFRGIGHGDGGNDTIFAAGEAWGDDGDDQFTINLATKTTVSIYGGAGNDTMDGAGDGVSSVYGGADNDFILSDGFIAYGDDGNDTIDNAFNGGGGSDSVFGGNGNDSLTGDTTHFGGAGDDTINAVAGTGYGDLGNDSIHAQFSYGGAGNDVLRLDPIRGEGTSFASEAYGGDGNDTLFGFADAIVNSGGIKVMSGGAGDDVIHTLGGERVDAGAGNDTIFAHSFDGAENQGVLLGDGADGLVMTVSSVQPEGDFGGDVLIKDFNPATDHLALIVTQNELTGLHYTITPNLAGNYTEIAFTQTNVPETLTYRFDGVTSLSASKINLYANEAAVTSGQSYRTLA